MCDGSLGMAPDRGGAPPRNARDVSGDCPPAHPSPAIGYMQHLIDLFAGTTTTTVPETAIDDKTGGLLQPDDDAPWSVIQSIRLRDDL